MKISLKQPFKTATDHSRNLIFLLCLLCQLRMLCDYQQHFADDSQRRLPVDITLFLELVFLPVHSSIILMFKCLNRRL